MSIIGNMFKSPKFKVGDFVTNIYGGAYLYLSDRPIYKVVKVSKDAFYVQGDMWPLPYDSFEKVEISELERLFYDKG